MFFKFALSMSNVNTNKILEMLCRLIWVLKIKQITMPVQQINVKNSSDIESWEWGGGCGREVMRTGSGSSRTSCSNSSGDICRICHCESEPHNPLLAPCYCSGKWKYTHEFYVEISVKKLAFLSYYTAVFFYWLFWIKFSLLYIV